MTKNYFWAMAVVAAFVLGTILTGNVVEAKPPAGVDIGAGQVRDNTTIFGPFTTSTAVVLIDNAGIGGTSNVEVTWEIADDECEPVTLGGTISAGGDSGAFGDFTILEDDDALGGFVNHADVTGTNAILLASTTGTCNMTIDDWITVSTVGALP